MAKDTQDTQGQTLKVIEDTTYNAYREWPVWLVLRQKELAAHHTDTTTTNENEKAQADGQKEE